LLPFIDLGLWKVLVQEFDYNILPISQTILKEGVQPNLSIPNQREREKTQSDGTWWIFTMLQIFKKVAKCVYGFSCESP